MADAVFDELKLGRREALIAKGLNPYPHTYKPSHSLAEARARKDELLGHVIRVAGRLSAIREMGKAQFMDIYDIDGHIQLHVKRNVVGEAVWEILHLLDLGDVIGAEGELFTTRTGELTVGVRELTVLAKAVVPLPISKEKDGRKWYALSDPEIRYRERYKDWIADLDSRRRFVLRSRIISEIRRKMDSDGFLEVTPPVLEPTYGGAEAQPFTTRVAALGEEEVFLRISLEIALKKYIVGGFPKVYAIGPNFRNEGIDRMHHPEFWMMEWYETYTDYEDQMARFEQLISHVAGAVLGTTKVRFGDLETDLAPPWRRISLAEAVKTSTGIDVESASAEELREACRRRGVPDEKLPASWGEGVMTLFEASCERELVGPVFVKDFPVDISPLTKRKRLADGKLSERWVERFEPYLFGMEIGNAYTELTDPVEQLERLSAQARTARGVPLDWDFVKAIGCGMPPTGGVGLGIDRLVMILTGAASVRDVIAFPLMRRAETPQPEAQDRSPGGSSAS